MLVRYDLSLHIPVKLLKGSLPKKSFTPLLVRLVKVKFNKQPTLLLVSKEFSLLPGDQAAIVAMSKIREDVQDCSKVVCYVCKHSVTKKTGEVRLHIAYVRSMS